MNVYQSLKENLSCPTFLVSKETSVTAASIISKSFEFKYVRALMGEQFSQLGEDKSASVSQRKQNMGNIKYASLRNTFNIISSGGPLPKYKYMLHIDTIKVVSLMQNTQEKLHLKAGRLGNFIVAGHRLKNIPVHERGGKGILFLFK